MQIYLPIAEMSVNIFVLLGLGAGVGFLSGMFGVGGGFLMTPLLIFIGIPPAVAVGSQANQIVASSVSGGIAHMRRGTIDFKMGTILLLGGAVGAVIGVFLFKVLSAFGQIDLLISLSYVVFLGTIGSLMLVESVNAIRRRRAGRTLRRKKNQHLWIHGLAFKTRFRKSGLYISAIPPFVLGLLVGGLSAIMGVGGGFIMIPAMIYLLNMPTNVVIGTSLFQITFVTGFITIMHAGTNQTVDIVLALALLAGAVVGAPFGAKVGLQLRGEQLRALLALLVLLVCGKLAADLVIKPAELYSLGVGGAG